MPAVTSLDTVHMAVFNALAASGALTALVGTRIYDTIAPQGVASPYVVLGQPTETAFDALQGLGNTNVLTIHLWSKDAATSGNAKIAAMYAAVKAALHRVRLTLSTGTVIDGTTDFVGSSLDADLVSMHGIVRYVARGFV